MICDKKNKKLIRWKIDNLFSQLEIRIIRSGKYKFKKTIVMNFNKKI